MEHARVTGNPDEERELRSSDNELLMELTALGPDTVDAAEEVLHAIAADHPWELALRALVRDEQSGWGDQALRACALYATEPSLCLRFTEPAARERIALAASDMLTGLVIDKPLDGFSKRRLCDALARNELPERLRVNLVDVLFRISEHHPRYRAEMESVLEQAGAMEGADRELKKRVKRALGWLRR